MRFSSARGSTKSRVALLALMAIAAIGATGCSGDQGNQGDQGPPGPVGPPGGSGGSTGPTGPTTIETGATVSLGNGSALTAEQIKSIGTLVAKIDKASLTTATAVRNPVIEFSLKTPYGGAVTDLAPSVLSVTVAKLIPAGGNKPSRWQSYVNRSQNASAGPKPLAKAIQATTEGGSTGVLEQLATPGTYRYTFKTDLAAVTTPLAVPYQPSLTHRVGFEIRMAGAAEPLAPDNPVKDFVPDGSAGSGSKLVADTANCADCHVRFELHGGPRRTVEYCVTCHNPGTVDPDSGESVDMAYLAHSIHSGEDRNTPYVIYGFGGATDFSEVTYPQSRLFCETCHTNSTATPNGDDWKTNVAAAQCAGCHDAGLGKTYDYTTALYTNTYTHSGFAFTANDGDCLDCHTAAGVAGATLANHDSGPRLAKELGAQFKYTVVSVTNVGIGQTPVIKFKISKPDGTPYVIATDPAFQGSSASLNLYFAWGNGDITNADGATGKTPAGNRATPYRMRIADLKTNAVLDGTGVYTTDLKISGTPVVLTVAPTTAMVMIDGHPVVTVAGVVTQARPGMAVGYAGTPRERLVSQVNCEKCHAQLSLHGGNRSGDPQGCTVCHNSGTGYSDSATLAGTVAFGAFVHNIHLGKVPAVGVITYPQSLKNCEGCHVAGSYNTARTGAVAISTGPGADQTLFTDDTWNSASAGTCGTCHDGFDAKAHMGQNGGSFDNLGGKTLTPSTAQESCAVCHGAGRIADTVAAHAE
jgi:OmcA/MtrC family decaheme c-type cytochrome